MSQLQSSKQHVVGPVMTVGPIVHKMGPYMVPYLAPCGKRAARPKAAPASVSFVPAARRLNVTLDEMTNEILRRFARPGQEAAYVRAAILEKAARDEVRGELDLLRTRLEHVERKLQITPNTTDAGRF